MYVPNSGIACVQREVPAAAEIYAGMYVKICIVLQSEAVVADVDTITFRWKEYVPVSGLKCSHITPFNAEGVLGKTVLLGVNKIVK